MLELLEVSLDHELADNALRIQLPRPVVGEVMFAERETERGMWELHITVITTRTFHHFTLPHPISQEPAREGASLGSVFARTTAVELLRDAFPLVSLALDVFYFPATIDKMFLSRRVSPEMDRSQGL